MNDSYKKYFLAANSAEGFVSHFGDCYDSYDGWKAYIIKGGPGTGKSSFMRYVAKEGEKKNLKVEYFPCSSDPNSLDAVSFPEIKTVIMDGTAPHIVDPKFVGICENLLDFGVFWNEELLSEKREEIIKLTLENKEAHKRASNYIKTAGNLIKSNYETALGFTDIKKAEIFAEKLIKKYIPKGDKKGYEWIRFLSGITPFSVVSYADSLLSVYENTVIIRDEYGVSSTIIFEKIRQYSLENGYEIITISNHILPSLITDGIIIPKLSVAFLRESKFMRFNSKVRRINSARFFKENYSDKKNKIKFNSTTSDLLISRAIDTLFEAKSVHDELEKCYVKAMDFDALTRFAESFVNKIL